MAHAAETLVDPLRIRQALSWQAGNAVPLAGDVPEQVLRSATTLMGDIDVSDREAVVQFDLAGRGHDHVHVGHHGHSVYVWIEDGDARIVEHFRIEVGAPFIGEGALATMAYGVLTVKLPAQHTDESGLHRRFR